MIFTATWAAMLSLLGATDDIHCTVGCYAFFAWCNRRYSLHRGLLCFLCLVQQMIFTAPWAVMLSLLGATDDIHCNVGCYAFFAWCNR
jgi:hypothetical protein